MFSTSGMLPITKYKALSLSLPAELAPYRYLVKLHTVKCLFWVNSRLIGTFPDQCQNRNESERGRCE